MLSLLFSDGSLGGIASGVGRKESQIRRHESFFADLFLASASHQFGGSL